MQAIDPESLQNGQYKSAVNLVSRIDLHRSFSANPYGWFRWVFDQLDLPPQARILELACGRADLWRDNTDRIPDGWDITLTDISEGMLDDARAWLAGSSHAFLFERADIQDIPFGDEQFDAVIANHMLYYVIDKPKAFGEVLRVLKPGGHFFTTTIGERHLRELVDLVVKFHPGGPGSVMDSSNLDFLLENGAAQLGPFFAAVYMRRYEDALFVTRAAPLIQYINSGTSGKLPKPAEDELRAYLDQKIRKEGGIHIFKDSGIFIARKGG